jgi:hypothetical protein
MPICRRKNVVQVLVEVFDSVVQQSGARKRGSMVVSSVFKTLLIVRNTHVNIPIAIPQSVVVVAAGWVVVVVAVGWVVVVVAVGWVRVHAKIFAVVQQVHLIDEAIWEVPGPPVEEWDIIRIPQWWCWRGSTG